MFRINASVCLVLAALHPAALAADDTPDEAPDERTATVGMPARIEQIVLPGPELEAKPRTDARQPIVLRVLASYRHGSDFRYDFEYYGLEPGVFDLKDYLKRKDGSSLTVVPSIRVKITPVLPPGQVEPNPLAASPLPKLGGYRTVLIAGAVVWGIGLLAILFVRRKRARLQAESAAEGETLAERLRILVTEAAAGRLSRGRLAELERLLLAHWRQRLDLEGKRPVEAISILRGHPQAGELLRQLEAWLHRPASAESNVDVEELLEPYQNVELT